MTVNISAVKKNSKIILKNKWVPAFTVFLIVATVFLSDYILSSLLISVFKADGIWGILSPARIPLLFSVKNLIPTVLMLVYRLFAVMPIFLGGIRWFWRFSCEKDDSISSVFYYYCSKKSLQRSLKITLVFSACVTLLGIIAMLAFYFVSLLSSNWLYELLRLNMPRIFAGGSIVNLFYVVCLVFFLYLLLRVVWYLPVAVIMEDKEPTEILTASIKIFSEFTVSGLVLFLSFLGWFALSAFLIPLMFVGPYFITSVMLFVKYAVNNYNLRLRA